MQKNIFFLAIIVTLVTPLTGFASMSDLPGVPISVTRTIEKPVPPQEITLTPRFNTGQNIDDQQVAAVKPVPASTLTAQYKKKKEQINRSLFDSSRVALNIIPGENMILPVAVSNPNRLLTPFSKPRVTTASSAQISVDHSIIYVTPTSEELVTMFITEEGSNQRNAISLTMVPRKIPPREVRLLITGKAKKGANGVVVSGDNDFSATAFDNIQASEWEKGSEYTDTIRDTMRELALGHTPQGYGLRQFKSNDPQPFCVSSAFKIEPAQVLDGHNIIVVVSRLTNTSDKMMHFKAASCYRPGVIAVSAWPKTIIAPDAQVELYVLYKRPDPAAQASTRPSLLTGGN